MLGAGCGKEDQRKKKRPGDERKTYRTKQEDYREELRKIYCKDIREREDEKPAGE